MVPRTAKKTRRRNGMTLIEILVYTALLGVFINGVMIMFVSMSRASTAGGNRLETLRAAEEARFAFSRVIRESTGVAPGIAAYRSGENQLVLAMPPEADAPATRYAVLGRIAGSNRPYVMELREAGGQIELVQNTVFRLPVTQVRFEVEGRLIKTIFEMPVPKRSGWQPAPFEFTSAIRAFPGGQS